MRTELHTLRVPALALAIAPLIGLAIAAAGTGRLACSAATPPASVDGTAQQSRELRPGELRITATELRVGQGFGRPDFVYAPEEGPVIRAPLQNLPESVIEGLLLQEDQAFYSHAGYSRREIAIVLYGFLFEGRRLRGASTLTQQLARTLFLSRERSLRRKLLELRLSQLLEARLSKDRILELYLNTVYWGAENRGVAAAARHYFDRSASRLRPEQAAFLVALLPNPAVCPRAPCDDPGAARRAARIERYLAALARDPERPRLRPQRP